MPHEDELLKLMLQRAESIGPHTLPKGEVKGGMPLPKFGGLDKIVGINGPIVRDGADGTLGTLGKIAELIGWKIGRWGLDKAKVHHENTNNTMVPKKWDEQPAYWLNQFVPSLKTSTDIELPPSLSNSNGLPGGL